MKEFRVFIENLPETVTESEIESEFSNFGDVVSIEIKERKIVTAKHTSCFFAYVNLKTSDENLQKCFQTFNENEWYGQYVKLQIAKESFLERLKREREAKLSNNNTEDVQPSTEAVPFKLLPPVRPIKKVISTEAQCNKEKNKIEKKPVKCKIEVSNSSESNVESENVNNAPSVAETEEIEIPKLKKRRTESTFENGILKIKSFEKNPIGKTSIDEKKVLTSRQAESEAKRKKAVQDKIRAYHQQKKEFKIFKTQPKIIKFDDDGDVRMDGNVEGYKKKSGSNKIDIFESSDSDVNEEDIQTTIENRIKSDERFALDERFNEEPEENDNETNEEKKDLEILEEVLGKKLRTKKNEQKSYIRYDPSNPDHQKYVLNDEKEVKKSKKKKKDNEKAAELKEAPEVSQERVFSKDVDFKSLLGQSNGFSLSEMFGNDKVTEKEQVCEEIPIPKRNNTSENPFKYDSSDDEDNNEVVNLEKEKPQIQKPRKVWTEPLFLQDNDFRFQEGMDFVERIASQKREEGQLEEERRKFKQIVRSKIRNVEKKNKRFKKLGGNKKKKMKRINKALAR